jgi:hypothetical protein
MNMAKSGTRVKYDDDLVQLGVDQEQLLNVGAKIQISVYECKVEDVKWSV